MIADELPQLELDLGGISIIPGGGCAGACGDTYLVQGGDNIYNWVLQAGASSISNGGGDQPHNNMQPYMALNYMIKVQAGEDILLQLQEEIDAQSQLLSSLENQQTPLTSSLSCVEMGVGQNCPEGLDFGTYTLTPNG